MKENVFGQGVAEGDASVNQTATEKVNQARKDVSGSLGGIQHYLGAHWGINTNLGDLNDDNKKDSSKKDEAHWGMVDIEEKFGLFTALGGYIGTYESSLSAYRGALATGKSDPLTVAELEKQETFVRQLKVLRNGWMRLIEASKGFFTFKSTVQKNTAIVKEQVGVAAEDCGKLKDLTAPQAEAKPANKAAG
jgi:hypothetical protein